MIDEAIARGPVAARAAQAPGELSLGTLFALALGAFAVGTEGFMIAAILPTVAHSLAVGVAAAGQLVTIFALVYAVSSSLLTALTAHVGRRTLLLTSLALFAAANLIAAAAPGFWALAGARVLLAMAAGVYVPNANAVAGALAPPHRRGRALAIINGGMTMAVAVGVPIGAVVGTNMGWRATFVGVALLSALAVAVLLARLPSRIEMATPASIRERLAIIGQSGVFSALLVTTCWAIGAYTVYTYVSPFLMVSAGLIAGETNCLPI